MKILNLYAGIGGNRSLWGNSHKITAVEYDTRIASVYLKRFPDDDVIVGDALEYVQKHYSEFDFIWASPPCQTHTRWRLSNGQCIPDHTSLYGLIVFLKQFHKKLFCIENVMPWYVPLIKPSVKLGRHLYWSNFYIEKHKFKTVDWDFMKADPKVLAKWHDINYDLVTLVKGKWKNHDKYGQILRNCVDRHIGKYILQSAMKKQKEIGDWMK